jgi:hypothetical protein
MKGFSRAPVDDYVRRQRPEILPKIQTKTVRNVRRPPRVVKMPSATCIPTANSSSSGVNLKAWGEFFWFALRRPCLTPAREA